MQIYLKILDFFEREKKISLNLKPLGDSRCYEVR